MPCRDHSDLHFQGWLTSLSQLLDCLWAVPSSELAEALTGLRTATSLVKFFFLIDLRCSHPADYLGYGIGERARFAPQL